MSQGTEMPFVRRMFLAVVAALMLLAPPASADQLGGEAIDVPAPVAESSPSAAAAAAKTKWTPIQISVAPPVQLFRDPDREVWGLRLNLPYGEGNTLTGLDLGMANLLDADLRGVQIAIANAVSGSGQGLQMGIFNWNGQQFTGLQTGFLNVIEGAGRGAQIGFANDSTTHTGVQLGFLNITESLKGLQIGVINVIANRDPVPFLPLINVGF